MQDSRTGQFSLSRKKKKNSTSKQSLIQLPPPNDGPPSLPSRIGRKVSMGAFYNSDSSSGNEYRAVRRKYLLLEEEGFALERKLKEAEDEVKSLEDEKLELLDQLVVLEGLVDPSESHHLITDSAKIM